MSGISTLASSAGSGAGIVIAGVSWITMRHMGKLPSGWHSTAHPVLHRLCIIGMWAGGSAIALTALGQWIIRAELWAASLFGGVGSGAGHTAAVLAGLFLAASVALALIWVPAEGAAWMALALPFVLALSGGHLHALLTIFPGASFAQSVSHWIGG